MAVFLRKEMRCAAAGRFCLHWRARCMASSSYLAVFSSRHYNSRVKSAWLGGFSILVMRGCRL
eukprot:1670667-Pyramimonas_sp.AAC.1